MKLKEFKEKWEEIIRDYKEVKVSMTGSWNQDHKKQALYILYRPFIDYEIPRSFYLDDVKLISKDGSSITVSVLYISSLF